MVTVPAVERPVGFLFPLVGSTDAWRVRLHFPEDSVICGGLAADAETRSKMPWKLRDEELRRLAESTSSTGDEDDESPGPMITKFRRRADGELCASANQVRTLMQEAARALYGADPGYFVLRRVLRSNIRYEPTLIPILRRDHPLYEPDGVLELARPIRKPPFERSIIQRPEYVKGPLDVHFTVVIARVGTAAVLTGEVLKVLLTYGGAYLGLGSHRGVDDVITGRPGKYVVQRFEPIPTQDIYPGMEEMDVPRLSHWEKPKRAAAVRKTSPIDDD